MELSSTSLLVQVAVKSALPRAITQAVIAQGTYLIGLAYFIKGGFRMTVEDAELPPGKELEDTDMALVECDQCGCRYETTVRSWRDKEREDYAIAAVSDSDARLNVTLTCTSCGSEIMFRQHGIVIDYRHDSRMFGHLPLGTSKLAIGLYEEATKCFINQTLRACANMCRATAEQVLVDQG